MSRIATLALTALWMGACNPADDPGFGHGGHASSLGDDTGGNAMSEGSPEITEIQGDFTQYTGTWVVEVDIYYLDDEDDLEGGKIHVDLSIDGEPEDKLDTVKIDNVEGVLDNGFVYFVLQGDGGSSIDTSVEYTMDLQLEDAQGNLSNTDTVTIDPL